MNYKIKEKLQTSVWFLKRPKYWKQYASLIKRRIYGDDEKDKQQAIAYCNSIAISLDDFLASNKIQHLEFKTAEKHIYKSALKKEKESIQTLGGGANLDLLFSIASLPSINLLLETGVAYGWSSLSLLAALENKDKGKLVSVDMPYPKMDNEQTVGIVVPNSLKKRWNLIREADITGIKNGLKFLGKIDMCHYDSDKSYQGRKWAYPILWKSLVPGGYFISDDIQDNLGFKEFCDSLNMKPSVILYETKYVGILVKP